MAQSKITLIGMEQYLNPDHSVFESLDLPDGINKDTLIGTILLRCQEFELLYSDPDFMIAAVNVWGKKNYWTFDRWVKLINKEYDPLYNKDYYEDISDIHSGQFNKSGTDSASGTSSESSDYTRTDNLANSSSSTDTHSEKAYNDNSFVNTTKDESSSSGTNTGTQRNAGQTSGNVSNQSSNSESGSDNHTDTHTFHGYGNIGITSAQELFVREANDVAVWNMYEHIADIFCKEFCIMIY